MITTVLFDLDGTLLPMDQDAYVKKYTEALTTFYAKKGHDPKLFAHGLFMSIVASMKNTSELTNEEMFWKVFNAETGTDLREDMGELYHFYAEIHPTMCSVVDQGRDSRRIVELLKQKGYRVALATNPVFPCMATYQRMSWVGLTPEDFELVTTYENSYRCKPNPDYFTEVAEKIGADPAECLVVGNDTRDDMVALLKGMQGYLITDYLIDRDGSLEKYPHGTYEEFVAMVENLPDIR